MKVLLLAAVASVALLATTDAGAEASGVPTLRLAGRQNLVVRGESFRAGERVVVTAVTSLGPRQVRVRATRGGSFRTTLHLSAQPCGRAVMVVAKGGAGSLATVRLTGSPCVPPPID
jgi:hypothetical protein